MFEVDNKNSFRNVDSQAPTIRIPGISPLPNVANSSSPQRPSFMHKLEDDLNKDKLLEDILTEAEIEELIFYLLDIRAE